MPLQIHEMDDQNNAARPKYIFSKNYILFGMDSGLTQENLA